MITRGLLVELENLFRPLTNRVANMVLRAVVNRAVDTGAIQTLQISVLDGEPLDGAEHMQNYGFSSVPGKGLQAVVLFPNGDHGHPLVVAVDGMYRPTGSDPWDVHVYHKSGSMVYLKESGSIEERPKAGGTVDILEVGAGALGATDELVHGTGVDPFTGSTYKILGNTSGKVRAAK